MKIAITDVCLLLLLYELKLATQFFKLEVEVHISTHIVDELRSDQQEYTKELVDAKKVIIHDLNEDDLKALREMSLPSSFCFNEKTGIYIAHKEKALALSSRTNILEYLNGGLYSGDICKYHGIFWMIKTLEAEKIIDNPTANTFYKALGEHNFTQNGAVKKVISSKVSTPITSQSSV